MKKKFIAILAIALAAMSVFAFAACTDDPPAAKEGVIYQSDVQSLWVGFGKAYATLENIPEPAEPVEGEQYGQVFKVYVDAGDGYTSWLNGTWSIAGDILTLTATWEEGENSTTLAGGESGVPKTYTATEDGSFVVSVGIPRAATLDFELAEIAWSTEK